MDLNFNYFCSIIVQKKRKKNLLVNLECDKKSAVKYRDGSLPICCPLWFFVFAVVSAYQLLLLTTVALVFIVFDVLARKEGVFLHQFLRGREDLKQPCWLLRVR